MSDIILVNEPGVLFRMENPKTLQGMWYDKDGNFNPFIKKLSNAKNKDLPMEFNKLYKDDGLAWLSATDKLEDLPFWFSLQDMVEMTDAGYLLVKYDVTKYRQVFGHAIFSREHVISESVLDLSIFDR